MTFALGDRVVLLETPHNRQGGHAGVEGEVIGISYEHEDHGAHVGYAVMLDEGQGTHFVLPEGLAKIGTAKGPRKREVLWFQDKTAALVYLATIPLFWALFLVGVWREWPVFLVGPGVALLCAPTFLTSRAVARQHRLDPTGGWAYGAFPYLLVGGGTTCAVSVVRG